MSELPDWLIAIKDSLPRWIDRVSHPDGIGRYRFAIDAYEPYDLDSSSMMQNVIFTTGGGSMGLPNPEQRREWIDYLSGLQRSQDGLMIDKGMERHIISRGNKPTEEEIFRVRFWTTRNGLVTITELGGEPRYRLAHQEAFSTSEEIIHYLETLHWDTPWGAGSWAGAAIVFQHLNRRLGDASAEEIIRAGVNWLIAHQDPETGAWFRGHNIPLHQLINGIFKVWIQVLPIADLPVQYPERVIDLCMRGLREDPLLSGVPDACSIFDVALVLDTALRYCDHRREEVADIARSYLPLLKPMVRPDGAFSYGPDGSLASHGGLALAPVKDQSDVAGTAINCHAIALLCSLCGLRQTLGWCPPTEWRMGLPTPG